VERHQRPPPVQSCWLDYLMKYEDSEEDTEDDEFA